MPASPNAELHDVVISRPGPTGPTPAHLLVQRGFISRYAQVVVRSDREVARFEQDASGVTLYNRARAGTGYGKTALPRPAASHALREAA